METLSFKHAIKAYMKRAGFDQAEVARGLRYTPAELNKWIRQANKLLNIIMKLSSLLGLSEQEKTELFSLAGFDTVVSLARQTVQIQSEQKDCGGRPRDEDNDWAFEQVYVLRRPHCEVYQEWLARRKEHSKFMQLADPYDSFKKALNTRRKKGKKRD